MAGSFIWFLICSCKSAGGAEGMLLGATKELDSLTTLLTRGGSDPSPSLYDVEAGAFAFKDDAMLNILSRSSVDILLIISDAILSMSGVGANPFSPGLSPLNDEEAAWTIF